LSLHKPTAKRRKRLKPVALFGQPQVSPELLMNVHKTGKFRDSVL
jgi:hypothetical protein